MVHSQKKTFLSTQMTNSGMLLGMGTVMPAMSGYPSDLVPRCQLLSHHEDGLFFNIVK